MPKHALAVSVISIFIIQIQTISEKSDHRIKELLRLENTQPALKGLCSGVGQEGWVKRQHRGLGFLRAQSHVVTALRAWGLGLGCPLG